MWGARCTLQSPHDADSDVSFPRILCFCKDGAGTRSSGMTRWINQDVFLVHYGLGNSKSTYPLPLISTPPKGRKKPLRQLPSLLPGISRFKGRDRPDRIGCSRRPPLTGSSISTRANSLQTGMPDSYEQYSCYSERDGTLTHRGAFIHRSVDGLAPLSEQRPIRIWQNPV